MRSYLFHNYMMVTNLMGVVTNIIDNN